MKANPWRASLAACAVLAALGGLAPGGDAQAPARGVAAPAPTKAPAPARPADGAANGGLRLKCFELAHADPEEVRQTLTQLWGQLTAAHSPGRPGVPGFAGVPAGAPGVPAGGPRIAVDGRTRTVFVRAPEKDLEAIGDLIAVLDADPGRGPEGKNGRVVHLRNTKVNEVLQVLTGLGLQGQVLALPRSNALLLTGPEADGKEVREVIDKLDVERKAETKPAPGRPAAKPAPPGRND
jgi:type II secretory pathway component GspD/PulD (secretin)